MYLVTYDICSPKRLQRVARLMAKFGGRVQKSVFECEMSAERLAQLQKKLKRIIDFEKDSVRFYHICFDCRSRIDFLGVGTLSEYVDMTAI
jgi:CRISPR-associated protein Cas2